jgi:hypothetical protein
VEGFEHSKHLFLSCSARFDALAAVQYESARKPCEALLHCRFAGIDPNDRGNDAATALWESMANGQVVLVTTEPLGGGPPVRSVFFVAEGDPAKAAAIIAAMMAPNERARRTDRFRKLLSDAAGHDFFLYLNNSILHGAKIPATTCRSSNRGRPLPQARCTKPMASLFSTRIFRAWLDSLTKNP